MERWPDNLHSYTRGDYGDEYPGVGVYEGVGGFPGGGQIGPGGYRGGAGYQSGGADYARSSEFGWGNDEHDEERSRHFSAPPGYHAGYGGEEREHMPRGYRERGAYWKRSGDDRGSVAYASRGHRGKGPKGYVRTDERIREDLSEELAEDDAIDPSNVSIEVSDGVVTLSGSVEQRWIKHRIEDIAEDCRGVKDVVNNLRVVRDQASGASSAPARADDKS